MSIEEISQLLKSGKVTIIDSRSLTDYMNGHIPDSVLAPYTNDFWFHEIGDYLKNLPHNIIIITGKIQNLDEFKGRINNFRSDAMVIEYDEMRKSVDIKESRLSEIDVQTLLNELDEWSIIDVREPYEWTTGIIPGAETIPMNDVPNSLSQIDKRKNYAIICEHGNRSLYAAIFMADRGFNVATVKDGMDAYRKHRLPLD